MRLLVVVTDSEAMEAFQRAFMESGDRGFTIVPKVIGRGRTGLRTGDRVHPGGLSLLFTAVADGDQPSTLAFLQGIRDRAGVTESTKIYSMPVDDVS